MWRERGRRRGERREGREEGGRREESERGRREEREGKRGGKREGGRWQYSAMVFCGHAVIDFSLMMQKSLFYAYCEFLL